MIVPFPPGGGNDTLGRLVAQRLSSTLGQQVIVDNRVGAGGNLGTELAARAKPDGYTLTLGFVANMAMTPRSLSGSRGGREGPVGDAALRLAGRASGGCAFQRRQNLSTTVARNDR